MLDKLYKFLENRNKPFTITEIFKNTDIDKTKENKNKLRKELNAFYVKDGNKYYPKTTYLENLYVRIKPTELEINNNIFILGHRIIPFLNREVNILDAELIYKKDKIQTIKKQFLMDRVNIYFSLLDFKRYPIIDVDENNSKIKTLVYDLEKFYKDHNFKYGDHIICKINSFDDGIFSISYEPRNEYELNYPAIKNNDKIFLDYLKQAIDKDMSVPNAEKQLMYAYYYFSNNSDADLESGLTSFGPLISREDTNITIKVLPNGIKVLHKADEEFDEEKYLNKHNMTDIDNIENVDDIDTIEQFFKFLNIPMNTTIVRALIFNQIEENDIFNPNEIIKTIFKHEYLEQKLVMKLQELLIEEYKKINTSKSDISEKDPIYLKTKQLRKKLIDNHLKIYDFVTMLEKYFNHENISDNYFGEIRKVLYQNSLHLYHLENKPNTIKWKKFDKSVKNIFESTDLLLKKIKDDLNFKEFVKDHEIYLFTVYLGYKPGIINSNIYRYVTAKDNISLDKLAEAIIESYELKSNSFYEFHSFSNYWNKSKNVYKPDKHKKENQLSTSEQIKNVFSVTNKQMWFCYHLPETKKNRDGCWFEFLITFDDVDSPKMYHDDFKRGYHVIKESGKSPINDVEKYKDHKKSANDQMNVEKIKRNAEKKYFEKLFEKNNEDSNPDHE